MHHLYNRKRAKNKYCIRKQVTTGEIRNHKSQEDRPKTRTMKTNNGWQKCKHNKHWVKRTTHKTKAPQEYADHVPLVTFVVTIYIRHDHPLIWIGGVMDSVFASSAVDRGFEPGRVKPKTITLVCVASPLKQVVLRGKGKDWLARNQNNVFEWGDKSTRGLLFQWASTIKIQLSVLV